MTTLVQHSCPVTNQISYQLLIPITQKLAGTIGEGPPSDEVSALQENLCGLIQVILIKVGEQLEKPLVDNIVQ